MSSIFKTSNYSNLLSSTVIGAECPERDLLNREAFYSTISTVSTGEYFGDETLVAKTASRGAGHIEVEGGEYPMMTAEELSPVSPVERKIGAKKIITQTMVEKAEGFIKRYSVEKFNRVLSEEAFMNMVTADKGAFASEFATHSRIANIGQDIDDNIKGLMNIDLANYLNHGESSSYATYKTNSVFDGLPLFSDSHVVGSGTQSNYETGKSITQANISSAIKQFTNRTDSAGLPMTINATHIICSVSDIDKFHVELGTQMLTSSPNNDISKLGAFGNLQVVASPYVQSGTWFVVNMDLLKRSLHTVLHTGIKVFELPVINGVGGVDASVRFSTVIGDWRSVLRCDE
jgi:hypothetical protein